MNMFFVSLITVASGTTPDTLIPLRWPGLRVPPLIPIMAGNYSSLFRLNLDVKQVYFPGDVGAPTEFVVGEVITIHSRIGRPFFAHRGDYIGQIGIGFDSSFSESFSSAMLAPIDGQFFLVPNPNDPSIYCLDGSLSYFPVISGGSNDYDYIETRYMARLGDQEFIPTESSPFLARISLTHPTSIPQSLLDLITAQLRIDGCLAQNLHLYPSIEIRIDATLIRIPPQDYIDESGGGRCRLKLTHSSDEYHAIGPDMIRNLGLVLDYSNRRVGICDPL